MIKYLDPLLMLVEVDPEASIKVFISGQSPMYLY